MSKIIVFTSSAEFLAKKFRREKSVKVIFSERKEDLRVFPDGEIYTRLTLPKSQPVWVVHAGSPNPNQGLVELEMILGILRQAKVKKIKLLFTYFPYGMQDKNLLGEINMPEAIIKKLVNYYKASKIYIIDPHFGGQAWLNKYPVETISTFDLFTTSVLNKYPEIVLMAPDKGGEKRTGLPSLVKKRFGTRNVKISIDKSLRRTIQGKLVGVVDDIIETGETLTAFHQACRKAGAKNLIAICSHGITVEGLKKVRNIYSKVYITNTVETAQGNIDIIPLILDVIRRDK